MYKEGLDLFFSGKTERKNFQAKLRNKESRRKKGKTHSVSISSKTYKALNELRAKLNKKRAKKIASLGGVVDEIVGLQNSELFRLLKINGIVKGYRPQKGTKKSK